MLSMTLQQIAQATQGVLHHGSETLVIDSVETDSRKVSAPCLFIALKGANFDAHDFCQQTVAAGATALLVERLLPLDCPQVVVADTRLALGDLARWQRQQFQGPVAAITGSNGKTTVKEMLASIMSQQSHTLATQGNFNNDIGLPLTLLRLEAEHQALVLELGANHIGEIAYTAAISQPTVALVNNVSAAHIEGFGSRDGVAQAKSEIFDPLTKDGIAVFAWDAPDAARFEQQAKPAQCWRFGIDAPQSEFYAQAVELHGVDGARFELVTPQGKVAIRLKVPGEHNVRNACAAAALAMAMGASLALIESGLNCFAGVNGRLNMTTPAPGVTLIDDSYNANPASYEAAIRLLASLPGVSILAAGEMAEMGQEALAAHQRIGQLTEQLGIELLATGGMMRHSVEQAGENAGYFDSKQTLLEVITHRIEQLNPHTPVNILVKGSRSARMEWVTQQIQNQLTRDTKC